MKNELSVYKTEATKSITLFGKVRIINSSLNKSRDFVHDKE